MSYIVYGFSGKAGSGKDYIAKNIFPKLLYASNILTKQDKILYLGFADPLKSMVAAQNGLSYEDVYGEKTVRTRLLLQQTGDDVRKKYGELYFTKALQFEIKKHSDKSNITVFIITDVRFPEEYKWIKETGGFIFRVHSPKRVEERVMKECKGDEEDMKKRSSHRSETLLDEYVFDKIIYNDPEDNPVQCISDWIVGKE